MADDEEAGRPAGASTARISISFGRTACRRGRHGPGAAPEEDFLKAMEEREMQSVGPSEALEELVIPLIKKGPRRQPPAQAPVPSTGTEAMVGGMLTQALQELMEESKKSLGEREAAGVAPTLAIPMIQNRCTPSREGAASEPQAEAAPEEADYEAVPVEAYGLAMLRGMGWRPGQGIGRTFNQVVTPHGNSLRPKGLGLGANLTETQVPAPPGPQRLPRPSEEQGDKEDQPRGLVPGGAVVVLSGPSRGLYGKVEGLDPDNVRAMVRLAKGSRVVTVSEYCLQPVSQREFNDNALDLSQGSKTSPGQQRGTASSQKAFQDQGLATRWAVEERKWKHLPDRQDEPASKSHHWLHRDLRVRFVDKLSKGGQYYNTKMTIEDVLSPDTCVCRTDEGQVLEDIREDMLETLVPKVQGTRVMVVLGPQAGRVGHLLGWDREQSQAVVQLRRETLLVELHYDALCQYVGPSDSDSD